MRLSKKEREILEEMRVNFKGRELLRKRDAKKLLTLSTNAVGQACKLLVASGVLDTDGMDSGFTEESWVAYDLLIHLVYEDWEQSEVINIEQENV